jgi:hypothetical protein
MSLPVFTNQELLLEIQHRAFRYFWETADPHTGLVNDRAKNTGHDDYIAASSAATGYGLAALPIAVEHDWVSHSEAAQRAKLTLDFLLRMSHNHGWMVHFIDKRSGERVWNSEYSSIDTTLLVYGAAVCGQYFLSDPATFEIAELSDTLFRRIDWDWILTNDQAHPEKKVVSHGWTPEHGFIPYNYGAYSEAILIYLLGLGAPQNPLPPSTWDAIQRPLQTYSNIESLKAGPIFIHQMPQNYLNLNHQRDRLGFDYWVSSMNAMRIHHQFCVDHSERKTYAEGFWGLNASDSPDGYSAFGAPDGPENSTVSPTGAISSITFTPDLAISAARLCYDRLGKQLWGRYGFGNAFNLDREWFDPDVIGIDLGMVLLAIENHFSGLIWKLWEHTPYATPALEKAGFHLTVEEEPRQVQRTGLINVQKTVSDLG